MKESYPSNANVVNNLKRQEELVEFLFLLLQFSTVFITTYRKLWYHSEKVNWNIF